MMGINPKRKSEEFDLDARPSKVAKTTTTQSTKTAPRKERKRVIKPSISAETFDSTASPLHAILTHTEPTNDKSETEVVKVDPGFIGSVSLAPNIFSTGSFGWKGSKRFTVELPSSNGDEGEKVQVMLSINATVIGSKPARVCKMKDAAEEDESKED